MASDELRDALAAGELRHVGDSIPLSSLRPATVYKYATTVPLSVDLLRDFGAISEQQYRVFKGLADPNPWPRLRLFRWWPRA